MEFSTKAVVLKRFGSYESITVETFPLLPLDDNVEVEVYFCGMNFADLYTRQGLMQDRKLPFVLGMECSGIVRRVGKPEITSLKVGDKVICYDYKGGLQQDVVRVSPSKCYLIPDHVDLEQAAAMFVNYLTAYFALFDLGNLKPNETIVIQSCAGGVGCAATQLAKTVPGVKIIGTASEQKEKAVKRNGVDIVLGYNDLEKQLKDVSPEGVDLIIDNQAGTGFTSLQNSLKHLGRIVLTGANSMIEGPKKLSTITLLKAWWNAKSISLMSLIMNNRSVSGLHLGVLAEKEPVKIEGALSHIFDLLKQEKLVPYIDSKWPLEEVICATKQLGERKNIGKVLLTLQPEKITEK